MAYQLTSNVEFDYSYSGSFTAITLSNVFSAFTTNYAPTVSSIVSVTIGVPLSASDTINAGYYSHITDNPTAIVTALSVFDLGYTSQASTYSYYTTAAGLKTTQTTGGPSNSNGGYGTLELGGTILTSSVGSSINFSGIDNTLVFDTSSTVGIGLLSSINNFQAAGDQIVFNGDAYSSGVITGYSNGVLTFSNGGVSTSLVLGGMTGTVTAANFSIGNAAAIEGGNASTYSGDVVITFVPCFLRGTMIETPHGEVAVETLRAGDLVAVIEAGRRVARPIRWVGGRSMRTADFEDRDEVFPIRIRRDAFGDAVPHRDLLVTPEHCVLTEAGLTPARMLVNGASILIDRSIPVYEFFHVELDRHGILVSEGLTTESYLDSGQRALFMNAASAAATRPEMLAAAPLAVDRAVVEPIWAGLAERARLLGHDRPPGGSPMTDQPDLRLLLDDGRELTACWQNAQQHSFHVPSGTRPIRLLSRAAVPAEVVGPFVDDRRTLGVAVDRLVFWLGLDEQVLPARDLGLRGWHRDDGAVRWTDGNAELDLPRANAETFLDVHVAATMLYRADARMAA